MVIVKPVKSATRRLLDRLGELFKKFDEGVETVLVLGIIWQAWRMWMLSHYTINDDYITPLNNAGANLTRASQTFWTSAINLHLVVPILIVISILSFWGLMEKNEYARLFGTLTACGWWFIAGTLLTIHSPMHDAGGLYFILGISGVIIYAHRFVMLDREKEVAAITWLVGGLLNIYNIWCKLTHKYKTSY